MRRILITITLLSIFIVYGCSPSRTIDKKEDYSNQQITIYTSYNDEQSFYKMYGNLIVQQFPGLDIRLVTSEHFTWDKVGEEVKRKSPDLVIAFADEYKKMAEDSYLLELEPLIKRDNFDIERYQPDMFRALRDSAGKLYGLSPNVNISGIIYNKELFDDSRIDYPEDGMDWYEILALASRFKGGIVGFESTFTSPGALLMEIVNTNKWHFIDEKRKVTTFNKEEWLSAIQAVVAVYQTNSVASGAGEFFFQGKSALYLAPVSSVDKLKSENQFSWGFVSTPVSINDKSISRSIFFNQVLSIPQDSSQKELAWEIIQMLMGEEAVNHYTDNEMLKTVSTLKKYAMDYNGVNLENIWRQSIDSNPSIFPDGLSGDFYDELYGMLDEYLQKTIERKITVEECVKIITRKIPEVYEMEKLKNGY